LGIITVGPVKGYSVVKAGEREVKLVEREKKSQDPAGI
jgi:hypothetical protein